MAQLVELRLGIEGLLVRVSPPAKSLCCNLERDNLSVAYYWFKPD